MNSGNGNGQSYSLVCSHCLLNSKIEFYQEKNTINSIDEVKFNDTEFEIYDTACFSCITQPVSNKEINAVKQIISSRNINIFELMHLSLQNSEVTKILEIFVEKSPFVKKLSILDVHQLIYFRSNVPAILKYISENLHLGELVVKLKNSRRFENSFVNFAKSTPKTLRSINLFFDKCSFYFFKTQISLNLGSNLTKITLSCYKSDETFISLLLQLAKSFFAEQLKSLSLNGLVDLTDGTAKYWSICSLLYNLHNANFLLLGDCRVEKTYPILCILPCFFNLQLELDSFSGARFLIQSKVAKEFFLRRVKVLCRLKSNYWKEDNYFLCTKKKKA
eukprot:snap_masked-scaffold_2-processed-gene-27.22-mRNA-1 protein AED:1.00 eAED:1.00 QI:0/-1/0/0/-1/1/1/0/332